MCCTLSGAGSPQLLECVMRIHGFQFTAVVVDEAAQAVEPSALIPLKFNPRVSDPPRLSTVLIEIVQMCSGANTGGRPSPAEGHDIQQSIQRYEL